MCDNVSLWFWCAFPWWLVMSSTFHMPFGHFYVSVEECLFKAFVHFLTELYGSFWLLSCSSLCILEIISLCDWYMVYRYFLLFSGFPPHSADCFLYCAKAFYFDINPVINYCFCCLCLWCYIHEIITKIINIKLSPHVFFWEFYSFRSCL